MEMTRDPNCDSSTHQELQQLTMGERALTVASMRYINETEGLKDANNKLKEHLQREVECRMKLQQALTMLDCRFNSRNSEFCQVVKERNELERIHQRGQQEAENELVQQKNEICSLKHDVQKLNQEVIAKEKIVANQRINLEIEQKKRYALQNDLKTLECKCNSLNSALQQMRKERNDLERKYQQCQSAFELQQTDLTHINDDMQVYTNESDGLKKANTGLIADIKCQTAERDKLAEELRLLECNYSMTVLELEDTKKSKNELERLHKDSLGAIDLQEKELTNIKEDVQKMAADALSYTSEIQRMKTINDNLNARLQRDKLCHEEQQKQLACLEDRLHSMCSELQEAANETRNVESARSKCDNIRQLQEQEISHLREKLQMHEKETERLNTEMTKLKTDLEQEICYKDNLQKIMVSLEDSINCKTAEMEQLSTVKIEFEKLQLQFRQRNETCEQELSYLRESVQTYCNEAEIQKKTNENLNIQIAEVTQSRDKLQNDLVLQKGKLDYTISTLEKTVKEKDDIERRMQDSLKGLDSQEKELRDVKQRIQSMVDDVTEARDMKATNTELNEQLQKETETKFKLQQDLESLENRFLTSIAELHEEKSDIERDHQIRQDEARQAFDVQKQELAKMIQHSQAYAKEVAYLKHTNLSLNDKIDCEMTCRKTLQDDLEVMECKYQSASYQLQEALKKNKELGRVHQAYQMDTRKQLFDLQQEAEDKLRKLLAKKNVADFIAENNKEEARQMGSEVDAVRAKVKVEMDTVQDEMSRLRHTLEECEAQSRCKDSQVNSYRTLLDTEQRIRRSITTTANQKLENTNINVFPRGSSADSVDQFVMRRLDKHIVRHLQKGRILYSY